MLNNGLNSSFQHACLTNCTLTWERSKRFCFMDHNPMDYVHYCNQTINQTVSVVRNTGFIIMKGVYLCLCFHNCVSGRVRGLSEAWMKNLLSSFPLSLSRWADSEAWQKMRRGWWLIRWLGTGLAILSLLTHSWGQDTGGERCKHSEVSPSSVNQVLLMGEHCFLVQMPWRA